MVLIVQSEMVLDGLRLKEYMWAFGQTQDWDLPTQLAAGKP